MRVLSTCVSALAALIAGLAGASAAHAGFVPALGSPFPYEAPTKALAVADGDRNGTVDVVAGGLTLRHGVGTGALANPIVASPTGPVEGLAAADLNGDGLLDYAAIAPGPPRRVVRLLALPGNGFVEETVLSGTDATEATDLAIANLDGDGLPDIAVVRAEADPNVTVAFGGMSGVDDYESGIAAPRDVELGDLNGDGQPEIVVAGDEPSVSLLVNHGGRTFAAGDLEPTGAAGATRRITLTQLDGDGRLDLLATDSGAAALLVLIGDSSGGFQPFGPRPTGLAGAAASVAAGDVNGDGATDAVAGGNGAFSVLLGNAGGGLAPAPGSPFATGAVAGETVEALVAADMNRDGQVDVVTANRNGSVSVQLNDETGLMSAAPTGVDFGTLLPASGVRTQNVTLRSNRGRLRLTRLDRQGSRVFSVRDVDCLNRTLTLGQACTVSVTFNAPRRARRYEALLSFDANAAALVVPLTATTRPPIVRSPRLKRKRVARGQRLLLRYRLSEGALTRVITERARAGRRVRVGKRGRAGQRVRAGCVAPKRGNLKRRRCTIWHPIARVTRRDQPGRSRMKLATRAKPRGVGRKRKRGEAYPAGSYRLSISALDRFRNRSEKQLLRFKVLRPRIKNSRPRG